MPERMSLDDYKKCGECRLNIQKCSTERTEKLMMEYEEAFQEFYNENWNPITVAGGMVSGLYKCLMIGFRWI